MARRIDELKQELEKLKELFPITHPRFRVVSYSLDELSVHFTGVTGEQIVLNCNISEILECGLPIWYSESENKMVCEVMEALADLPMKSGSRGCILKSCEFLARELCQKSGLDQPAELEILSQFCELGESDRESESEDEECDISGIGIEDDIDEEVRKKEQEDDGISTHNLAVLNRIKQNERSSYVAGTATGSVQASDRIMKDLKAIYKSDSFKNGHYTVEIINDNLYNWSVKILQVDRDSPLYADLKKLNSKEKEKAYIELQLLFKENFPFVPPFVRVVKPILTGGFVFGGGAICMELLTRQGWSGAYSIESLIMQVIATLCKGKTRILFSAKAETYSYSAAVLSFKRLVEIHEQTGWRTPPKSDG